MSLFENEIISKRYVESGIVDSEQSVVLGSSRFNEEWNLYLRKIVPLCKMPKSFDKILNVVWFLSPEKYNVHMEEVSRIVNYLGKFKNFKVIIKPHTRRHNMRILKNLPENFLLNVLIC